MVFFMKTNRLPDSVWTDSQAAGSQSHQFSQASSPYLRCDNTHQTGRASNDASYENEVSQAMAKVIANKKNAHTASVSGMPYVEKAMNINGDYKKATSETSFSRNSIAHSNDALSKKIKQDFQDFTSTSGIQVNIEADNAEPLMHNSRGNRNLVNNNKINSKINSNITNTDKSNPSKLGCKQVVNQQHNNIPERIFMNGLLKHTAIALAIIIPLAAFSAYAAPANIVSSTTTGSSPTASMKAATLAVEPADIMHKFATTPTTVDSVDLAKYAGTWYEIARLPMYFQRNCDRDVTATYTSKTDGSGIVVTNKCVGKDGKGIAADGLAKPVDSTGSKLKVTFLPSWIRWLPVGRADYWVLARDANYQTALVGTPDKDYLWLLGRTPDISQQTYAKYRQIAQQQGYDLREFKLTHQSSQTVNLVP